jgi:hypothetical protein
MNDKSDWLLSNGKAILFAIVVLNSLIVFAQIGLDIALFNVLGGLYAAFVLGKIKG